MALNKTIIIKIREKTESEPDIGDFLVNLYGFQSESIGQWKVKYGSVLESACKEVKKDANH